MAKRSFTLIELLVVVAIVAVLIAILLPALNAAREKGRVIVCGSKMRQMHLAVGFYAEDDDLGLLPNCFGSSVDGRQHWFHLIYPFMVRGKPPSSNLTRKYEMYWCPSGDEYIRWWGTASYNGGNYGYCAPLGPGHWNNPYKYIKNGRVKMSQLQEPVRTMMFTDSGAVGIEYTGESRYGILIKGDFRHQGQLNLIYCDGHVDLLSRTDPRCWGSDELFMRPYFPYYNSDG